MVLLEVSDVKQYVGERLLFALPSCKIYAGDKIGIVGANGSGKTTLMNILYGDIAPDEGLCKRHCVISYIRQFSEEKAAADQRLMREFLISGKTDRPTLSGGEQTRVKISNALSLGHRVLFADEPTSNLDSDGIELLYQKLCLVETLVIISHDRDLLDRLCNKTIEIRDGVVTTYRGNYSFYKEQSLQKHEQDVFAYQQYLAEKARLEDAKAGAKVRASSIRKAPRRMGNSEARLHRRSAEESSEKLHNSAKALQSRIDQLEAKEKPKEAPPIRLDFSLTDPPYNKIVISGKALTFAYGSQAVFDRADFAIRNKAKVAVVGANGAGKTTLLNLITGQCDAITSVPKAKLGYFHQGFENLEQDKTVLENMMRDCVQSPQAARMVLAGLLFRGDDVYKKAAVLSGGEKVKLALAKLITSDANVLLLDEPTNYLDIDSIEAVQALLSGYEGTLLFVSHDKVLVRQVANQLLIVQDKQLRLFDGSLDEYESKNEGAHQAQDAAEKMALDMRLARILSDMGKANADLPALEREYAETLSQLREANRLPGA